jgi:hypothetical protein
LILTFCHKCFLQDNSTKYFCSIKFKKNQNYIFMKKLLLILGVTLFATASTYAQKETRVGRPSISVGVDGALPLGDFKESHKFGIGGTVKGAVPVATGVDITLTTGYISFGGKTDSDWGEIYKVPAVNMIPIKAGVRYTFAAGPYFEPQIGYTLLSAKGMKSTGAFTYAANVGVMISPQVDLGVRYEAMSKNSSTSSFLGARLAYNFSL